MARALGGHPAGGGGGARALLRAVVPVWLGWLAAIVAILALGDLLGFVRDSFRPPAFLWPLFDWDYNLYRRIAEEGYGAGEAAFFAFFPLWPLVLRLSAPLPEWVAGGAVAAVASLLAFLGVARASPLGQERRVAVALACLPGSYALALAYPDGLALAAAAWACVLLAADRPLAAAVAAAVAAVARPSAFLVAVPLALLARGRRLAWVAPVAPLAAAAGVHAFFWHRSGEPDAFLEAQEIWGRGGLGHWFAEGAWRAALLLVAAAGGALAFVLWRRGRRAVGAVVYAAAAVVLFVLAGSTQTRIEVVRAVLVVFPLLGATWLLPVTFRPWAIFATLVVALPLLSGSIQSFGRQALFAFPLVWAGAYGALIARTRWPTLAAVVANAALLVAVQRYPP